MLRRFVLYWLPVFLWMMVIFGASTSMGSPKHTSRFIRPFLLWLDPQISETTIELVHHCVRKTAHAVEYAILGVLLWRLARSSKTGRQKAIGWSFAVALGLAALYAATDETHQIFVPGRQASIYDVMLDTCGAAAGLAVIWGVLKLRRAE